MDEKSREQLFTDLRAALYDFFRWRGHPDPDEASQETLLRLHEKTNSGAVTIKDVKSYVFGIARHLLADSLRKELALPIDDWPEQQPAFVDPPSREAMYVCLERCIKEVLKPAQGRFLPRYFSGRGPTKIEARRKMAEKLGITPTALRLRVTKLIKRIRPCVMECCAADRHKMSDTRLSE